MKTIEQDDRKNIHAIIWITALVLAAQAIAVIALSSIDQV